MDIRAFVMLLAGSAVLVQGSAPGAADTPEQIYEAAFGQEARKVAASGSKRDDAAFAKKLLETAAEIDGPPALRALLWRKAYEFGITARDGYATAIEAARLLAEAGLDERGEWDEKLLRAYDLRFRHAGAQERQAAGETLLEQLLTRGEARLAANEPGLALGFLRRASAVAAQLRSPRTREILAKIRSAVAREKIEQRISELERAVAAGPDDAAAAGTLLMLYLVDRDDPKKAAGLLESVQVNEMLTTYVPLAAKPTAEVRAAACLELAEWYKQLAATASTHARPRMLLRAKGYYEQFLARRKEQDLESLRVRLALQELEKRLAKEESVIVGGSKWFDLIAEAIKSKAYEQTEPVGGKGGSSFRDLPKDGGLLIGFRLTHGSFRGKTIKSLQPIYLTRKGNALGRTAGNPSGKVYVVQARPGYAVGGVIGVTGVRIRGLRVIFMKIQGLGLNPHSRYLSEWHATPGGPDVSSIGGTGQFVIGIAGSRGGDADSLRLILAKPLRGQAKQ